jgi:hypothetical protein
MRERDDIAELRAAGAAVRAEWQADEAEWTRAALDVWEHHRTLADVARDCMHRGDVVACEVGGTTFTGGIVGVGDDFVRVAVGSGPVDVHLAGGGCVFRVVERARAGGSRGHGGATTFRARLLELEARGSSVEVGVAATTGALRGVLRVGRDQLSIETCDGLRTYVAIGSVGWVRPVDVD